MSQLSFDLTERRHPATGLAPGPPHSPAARSHETVCEVIGKDDTRIALSEAHGYDIDAVLAASHEFRQTVGGLAWKLMTRGEALHIVRALTAVQA